MAKSIFVVTNPEDGWDCVRGVYKAESEEALRKYLNEESGRDTEDESIIHEQFEINEI